MNTKNIFAIGLLFYGLASMAQNIKRPDSYNYQRGVEAMQNGNTEESLEFFNKDLQENPKNGYSYAWIAIIRTYEEEYGPALSAAEMALKLIPKKDVEWLAVVFSTRTDVYLNLEDTVSAIVDLTSAIKCTPNDANIYEKRAQIYYEQEKYELSDADYKKMIEIDKGETMGYMGLGRNANAQERWTDAIKQFDYVAKLASDYSQPYTFRAESYIGLEKWSEATDDIIKAISLDYDQRAQAIALTLKEPAFSMLVSKMNIQSKKSPNEAIWPYVIAMMYEQNNQYKKAAECYASAAAKDASPVFYKRMSDCQRQVGDFEEALNSINQAISIDSTDLSYSVRKADILYDLGNVKLAIEELDDILSAEPEYGSGYYMRGWCKYLDDDTEGAIEDLTTASILEPDNSYIYITRADAYMKLDKKELAEADYNKVIEIESTPEDYDRIAYAYHGLGQNDKAIAAMDSIIARDSINSFYDAACLYSRMKDKEKALLFLEKSLESGYKSFAHIERDYDLDFIRDTEEFKALIQKYKAAQEADTESSSNARRNKELVTTEIPFTKENGVCKVKCKINDLPLYFIFDTGASDVTLSMVEATFMMKNGYLSNKDVVGSQHYMDANGNVSVGTVINLNNVNFGELKLTNIRASVVRNQKAPLLLGQSVLGRLGKIEIDNSKRVLRITQSK